MENISQLRSLAYERDKHGAGWGACDVVSIAYVLGHTCAVDVLGDPCGRKSVEARTTYYGEVNSDGHGDGFGNGDGYGDDCGAGNGVSNGSGNGYNHNYNGYGNGGGNCSGKGSGNGDYNEGQPWKV